jgi:hypothetical protein
MSAVYDYRSYSENINAKPMATSLREMAEAISYYTTLLEAFKANQSTVALLLSATQNIVTAAEQLAPRECEIEASPSGGGAQLAHNARGAK